MDKIKNLDHDLSRNEIEQVSESRSRSFFSDNYAALIALSIDQSIFISGPVRSISHNTNQTD